MSSGRSQTIVWKRGVVYERECIFQIEKNVAVMVFWRFPSCLYFLHSGARCRIFKWMQSSSSSIFLIAHCLVSLHVTQNLWKMGLHNPDSASTAGGKPSLKPLALIFVPRLQNFRDGIQCFGCGAGGQLYSAKPRSFWCAALLTPPPPP